MVKVRVLELVLVFLVICAYIIPSVGLVMVAVQLCLMATLVWRQTSSMTKPQAPVLNTLRAIFGSLVLAGGEAILLRAIDTNGALLSPVAVHMGVAYAAMAISDYMFHRFIWHAHWTKTHRGSHFWRTVYLHYLQHYLAHHKHSLEKSTIPKMRALESSPLRPARKAEIEASFTTNDELDTLACSNHGFTVSDFCRLSTVTMQLALPSGTCIVADAMSQRETGVVIHVAWLLLPLYLVIHHDKYHCTSEARHKWADMKARNFVERTFWKLSEVDVVCKEHLEHHHGVARHGERFFGLVPWGRFFIYPVFQTW